MFYIPQVILTGLDKSAYIEKLCVEWGEHRHQLAHQCSLCEKFTYT